MGIDEAQAGAFAFAEARNTLVNRARHVWLYCHSRTHWPGDAKVKREGATASKIMAQTSTHHAATPCDYSNPTSLIYRPTVDDKA